MFAELKQRYVEFKDDLSLGIMATMLLGIAMLYLVAFALDFFRI